MISHHIIIAICTVNILYKMVFDRKFITNEYTFFFTNGPDNSYNQTRLELLRYAPLLVTKRCHMTKELT